MQIFVPRSREVDMQKKFKSIFALFLIIVFGVTFFVGCAFFQFTEYDPDDGYDDPD